MLLPLPEHVVEIVKILQENGYDAYAVGGCVRDMLMGKSAHDYDVTTAAPPEAVCKLFERTVPTGIAHGTVTVLSETAVEVTTFRTEGGYSDSRHPDEVHFVSELELDLARRDFTVNAIAYSPETGIIDPFGGIEDIKKGILRAVGEPKKRFSEDALRILRLFRFASKLGFAPEARTLEAALELSKTLESISRERIAAELEKAVMGVAVQSLEALLKQGALEFLGLEFNAPLGAISALEADVDIRLCAFCLLCKASPKAVARAIKSSNARIYRFKNAETLLNAPFECSRVFIKQCLRQTNEQAVRDVLALRAAIYGEDVAKGLGLLEDVLKSGEAYTVSMLTIGGKELKNAGFSGRAVGDMLEKILDAVILDPTLNTPDSLEQYIRMGRME